MIPAASFVTQHRLQVQEFCQQVQWPFAEYPELTLRIEEDARRVVLRGIQRVACQKETIHVVTYPASWWDAFKDRFVFLKRYLRWKPARYKTARVDMDVLYPKIALNREPYIVITEMKWD